MDEKTSLNELISRFQQARQRAASASSETLGSASPERLEEVTRGLQAIAALEKFLGLTEDGLGSSQSADGAPTWRAVAPGEAVPAGGEPRPLVAGYEILGELGRGGMGVVYKARQVRADRVVALKMILAGAHAGASELARFRTEAEAVARLQHPNIVQVFEVGEHQGLPFFSLEFCPGGSLDRKLAGQPLPPREAAALVEKLARAVHAAHERGVVHRDLKPANVLLAEDGSPKVTDFGLAKKLDEAGLTTSNAVLGTPSYMAPEQADGRRAVGPPADVYALGAILYDALTGRPPFRAATPLDTILQVLKAEPVPVRQVQPQAPRDLEVVCQKCLHKDPARRYASALELAEDLCRFLAGEPIRARAVGRAERAWRWCRRNPAVAGLLTAVALSLLGGLAAALHFGFRAEAQARQAERDRAAAEAARAQEEAARRAAQDSAEQRRRALVRQSVLNGTHLLEAGERAQGVWWYARAWELDARDPAAQDSHRLRLGFALRDGPQLVGVCFHRRPVLDAVFRPDGRRVLTRTDAARAYLWDPFAGRLAAPPLVHDGLVRAAAFSPSGDRVATGAADGTLRLWDGDSGTLLLALPQGAAVEALAYDRAGRWLAVATRAGAVRVLDARTGQDAAPALDLKAAVYHVAFDRDGRRLLTADVGGSARVWQVETGRPVTDPLPHRDHRAENDVNTRYRCWPVFSPDGTAVVTVPADGPSSVRVVVTDLASGEPRYRLRQFTASLLHHVRFSPDGSRLLALSGDAVNCYEAATGAFVRSLRPPRETPHADFRPDGKELAACSTGGLVHRWDPATGKALDQPLRCADGVHALAYSPDGRYLLAASHDGTARVWRVGALSLARRYDWACGRSDRLAVTSGGDRVRRSPDGRLAVRYGGPAGVRLRTGAGTEIRLDHPLAVIGAWFSPDGRRVLTQDEKATLRWWDAATGQPAAPDVAVKTRLYDLGFSADGRRLLTVEDGPTHRPAGRVVTVWDVAAGRPLLGPLRAWDTGPQIYGERALRHQIAQAALSPDGTRLALASNATGTLGVWDVDGGRELVRRRAFGGELHGLVFSPDGRRFLAYGSDTVARLWHTARVEPAGPPLRHPRFCRRADLGPDGWRVATIDAAKVVRLWDGRTGDLLGRVPLLEKTSLPLWFSRDGKGLVIDSGQWILDLPTYRGRPEQLPALLRLLTGLSLAADDSIAEVDAQTFVQDPAPYRRAWHAWLGRDDVPTGLPEK